MPHSRDSRKPNTYLWRTRDFIETDDFYTSRTFFMCHDFGHVHFFRFDPEIWIDLSGNLPFSVKWLLVRICPFKRFNLACYHSMGYKSLIQSAWTFSWMKITRRQWLRRQQHEQQQPKWQKETVTLATQLWLIKMPCMQNSKCHIGHKISDKIPTATHFQVSANLNLFGQVFTCAERPSVLYYAASRNAGTGHRNTGPMSEWW